MFILLSDKNFKSKLKLGLSPIAGVSPFDLVCVRQNISKSWVKVVILSDSNISEYMAILSGNTDLLEKAKLEKRIASLEGERKSFNKGKANAEFTLNNTQKEFDNNRVIIEGMTADYNKFLAATKTDKEGNRLNLVKLDDFPSVDEKAIGRKLQEIAKNATTGGQYVRVGELYGFPIKVISETSLSNGLATIDNRFVIEGHYKYTFNKDIWQWQVRKLLQPTSLMRWRRYRVVLPNEKRKMKHYQSRFLNCKR